MFAKRIKTRRVKLGKTIEQVAVDCECTAGYIRNLEKGNSKTPSLELVEKLEASLKLSGLASQIPALVAERVREVENPAQLKLICSVLDADKETLKALKEVVSRDGEDT